MQSSSAVREREKEREGRACSDSRFPPKFPTGKLVLNSFILGVLAAIWITGVEQLNQVKPWRFGLKESIGDEVISVTW